MRDANEYIRAAVNGDRFALGRLFHDVQSGLRRHIEQNIPKNLAKSIDPAELLSETMAKATRHVAKFRGTSIDQFTGWLRTIAVRCILDDICRLQRINANGQAGHHGRLAQSDSARILSRLEKSATDPDDTPSKKLARKEAIEAIRLRVAALPENQRVAIQLHFLEGKSIEATAAEMECSLGAVRGLVFRAKKSLHDALGRSSRWFSGK